MSSFKLYELKSFKKYHPRGIFKGRRDEIGGGYFAPLPLYPFRA